MFSVKLLIWVEWNHQKFKSIHSFTIYEVYSMISITCYTLVVFSQHKKWDFVCFIDPNLYWRRQWRSKLKNPLPNKLSKFLNLLTDFCNFLNKFKNWEVLVFKWAMLCQFCFTNVDSRLMLKIYTFIQTPCRRTGFLCGMF